MSTTPTDATPIRYYEANPADQRKASLTCHGCRLTLDMTISKDRIVKFCPCCGKAAETG